MNSSLIGGSTYTPKPGFEFRYYTRKELEQSPSKADGLDDEKIGFFRRQFYSFLSRMSAELKLNIWVNQTAAVYCERFFAKRSFAKNDRFLIVAAALFLASKAMDGPRPVAHVAHAYFKVKNANKAEELAALARDPQGKLKEHDVLESIILAERAILYTLAFQIKIELPQTCLFKNLESVGVYTFTPKDSAPQSNLNAEQQQRLSQIAVNFANDSYKTSLPIQYPVEKLAAACLYHSARLNKIDLAKDAHIPGGKSFQEAFNISQAELDDIYDQLHLTFYAPKPEASKKGAAAAAGQQPVPSPSAASEATRQHGLPQHPHQHPHMQPPPGSQAAPIVLRPPPNASSQHPKAAANGHPKPAAPAAASTSSLHVMEEGELPDGGMPPAHRSAPAAAAAAAQGHQHHGMPRQTVSQQQGGAVPRVSGRPHGAGTSQTGQQGNSLPQGEMRGPGHEGGSRKVARVGEQQHAGPGAQQQRAQLHAAQSRPQAPHLQSQRGAAAAPASTSSIPAQQPLPATVQQWGGGENSRKRKAEELGEPRPQGLVL
ncbi:hypothetical protein DUNSADRAFT_17404 [Dunaliella salina]|uniref:Cyclin-like domain-containing protein n=1 Tax=Dunaliella salina TaxID=3046 RepID=A0ABQ7G1S4_DUNSA|nr:hypothetical protein DUNSADRAFT_17404 [Dunaliella salina]|eukprot:KAF5828562.1 hypothetical protein DUNSADRAFT_17404 [Dunaliella salina]